MTSLLQDGEPCPFCGCPANQFDGHVCEDFAPVVQHRRPPGPLSDGEIAAVAFALPHVNHDGLAGAPDGVACPRCEAERALARLVALADLTPLLISYALSGPTNPASVSLRDRTVATARAILEGATLHTADPDPSTTYDTST